MKVFKFDMEESFSVGLTFLAAESADEAMKILRDNDCETPVGCSFVSPDYIGRGNLTEIPELTWSGKPGIIAHRYYAE